MRKLQICSSKSPRNGGAKKGNTIERVSGCDVCGARLKHDCGRSLGSVIMAISCGVVVDASRIRFYCSESCREKDM